MRRALCAILALVPYGASAQNPLEVLRLDELSVTRTRPLFAPTRRAPAPVGEAPAPQVEETPSVAEGPPFELLGLAIGRQTAFLLLRNKSTGKVVRLQQGGQEEGWRIEAIAPRSVRLTRDGRTIDLAIYAPTTVEVGAQGAAAEAKPFLAESRRDGVSPDH